MRLIYSEPFSALLYFDTVERPPPFDVPSYTAQKVFFRQSCKLDHDAQI